MQKGTLRAKRTAKVQTGAVRSGLSLFAQKIMGYSEIYQKKIKGLDWTERLRRLIRNYTILMCVQDYLRDVMHEFDLPQGIKRF